MGLEFRVCLGLRNLREVGGLRVFRGFRGSRARGFGFRVSGLGFIRVWAILGK